MEFIREKTACFTGHRSSKLPWLADESDERRRETENRLLKELENAVLRGYDTFLCGMALGFDMLCAQAVLRLKAGHPQVKLVAALPCRTQAERWSAANRESYEDILKKCDFVRCLYDGYIGAGCMHERNRFMVDNSSLVIALFDGSGGGTKFTVDYAEKKKIQIINILKK